MQNWKQKYTSFKQKPARKETSAQENRPLKPLDSSLKSNISFIRQVFGEDSDLIVRNFKVYGRYDAAIIFFSSVVDQNQIQNYVLKPLMNVSSDPSEIPEDLKDLADYIWSMTVQVTQGNRTKDLNTLASILLEGNVVLLIDEMDQALYFNLRKIEHRSIEQPQTEQVIRGSRDGFIENLQSNLSLLRYRLQTPDFRVVTAPLGARTRSKVAVCYIEGIADPGLVQKVMKRLSAINVDGILDSGYIEQFIEDHPLSPFPQVQPTERPDKSIASLLEGRVIILVDGSPFCLIVPALFNQFFQTVDDYTERFVVGSLLRMIRLIALLFSLFFPALYVSIISFNPELLPTEFAVAITGARAGVPFPAVLEVLIMEVFMEVLREATIRLPQMIGGALSIVGVLVIGQAAVAAGLASPTTVVVVAITTIGSFATPAYNAAISSRMLRFPLIILAGCFGLYGVMLGTIVIVNHLLFLESFGVPYMTPFVPTIWKDLKDSIVRVPLWWMRSRPSFLNTPDPDLLANDIPKMHTDLIFKEKGEPDES
ncbi:spore germination protein [Paenibacillus sp. B-A-8]|uniref:spore germination protein n=1 Tax=Paenibacillus sp. B-A-8 TaxID=3400419 RepID=UPI003B0287C9